MSKTAPPPPDLAAHIRERRSGSPLTLMEELEIQFEARVKANGGRLVPLSESAPPPPDLVEAIRLQAIRNLRARGKK